MEKFWEFPGGPEVGTLHFLIGELGSHRLRDAVRKKKKEKFCQEIRVLCFFLVLSVNMRI